MKKYFLLAMIFVALGLYLKGTASAALINKTYAGDRVVYDTLNHLYWYPFLTDFIDMNRADQEAKINSLMYAGSTDWKIASWYQVNLLKMSLAAMATVDFVPTCFDDFGNPDYGDRTIASPFLAWEVLADRFFTPTEIVDSIIMPPLVYINMPAQVFNGRTSDDGWGWRNPYVGNSFEWAQGDADDHWVTFPLFNENNDFSAMVFNFDQHYLPDDATCHADMFFTKVGAWAVTSHVAPLPSTLLLMATSILGIVPNRRFIKKLISYNLR